MKPLLVCAMALAVSAVALAQDPVKTNPTHYKVIVDNPSVRVLRVSYAPGEASTMHSHPDSIVIPLAAGTVKFTGQDGKSQEQTMANESAMYIPAGAHVSTNMGKAKVDAILVEFKAPAPGKAAIPTQREGLTIKVLAEGPRAVAYRSTMSPTFAEPAGTKHDFDQVVISLAPAQISLTLNGKAAKSNWTRGDVEFIPRGTAHESKNTGGKPVDVIIVAIK